ncbi:MAG: tRNA 2-thiouridine(34) synthase MnmA [Oscillospiraceae bacterium]|nr:tRNA 2-thiouridine(34) synthase MnmA [Oscillospiraceae bacterium]
MNKQKALIAMSGGVDSSVSAALMVQAGYACVGVNMKLHAGASEDDLGAKTCCSLTDAEDARSVCRKLGMPFHVFNFTEDFSREVIDRFVCAYERGATPNPCIDCNKYMKFSKLYQRAQLLGCELIVTGHYARVEFCPDRQRWVLKKAKNLAKDQSYVLYFLTQEQLAHTRFPLGEFESKEQIRAIAEELDLITAKKSDSQDICFVPDGRYADFLSEYTGKTYPEGDFVDQQGNVLGKHKGIVRYTIGQRKGLGLALPESMYVRKKDMERNQVVLSTNAELFSRRLLADTFTWSAMDAPAEPIRCKAKARYQAREADCTVTALPDGQVEVLFDEPQRALTVGQAVVLYDEEVVLGGGVICEV